VPLLLLPLLLLPLLLLLLLFLLLLLLLQVLGDYKNNDYSSLNLKGDHFNRPLWVCSDGRIFLETYSPIYKQVHTCY
jgi:hypothetical protein